MLKKAPTFKNRGTKKEDPIYTTGLPFIKICLKAYSFNLCIYYSILLNVCHKF